MKKYIAVFCGSSKGHSINYQNKSKELGRMMVENDHHLVYGAGNVGLMGIIADEILSLGHEVIGVIPQHLVDMEVAHQGLTELIITQTMHERKAIMAAKASGFIAMPGGIGTLEEITEIMTWAQLNLHQKPTAFYNIDGYFDKLIGFMHHMESEGFLKKKHIDNLIIDSNAKILIEKMNNYQSEYTPKWVKP